MFDLMGRVPAIAQARMVERFGRRDDEWTALRAARRADLTPRLPRAVRAHLKWAASRSLYDGGAVGKVVSTAAARPQLLSRVPTKIAKIVYDKGPALLLSQGGGLQAMEILTRQSLVRRATDDRLGRASDEYYLGHVLRNQLRVNEASACLRRAAEGLVDEDGRSDVERLAGVVLEQGILALYRGEFRGALRHAADLRDTRGLYAISRWSAWGAWLAGTAHTYLAAVEQQEAESHLRLAGDRFGDADEDFDLAGYPSGGHDVSIGRLLLARVSKAVGDPNAPLPVLPDNAGSLRQQQDVALLRADFALAGGDATGARQLLEPILADPATPASAAWARLGLAEADRIIGRDAQEDLLRLGRESRGLGAAWLSGQVDQALLRGGGTPLSSQLARQVGDPPVLWLVT